MRKPALLASSLLVVSLAGPASAQLCEDVPGGAPDVIVGDLQDVRRWGEVGTKTAFSVGTDSCNVGDCWLKWFSDVNEHPVIGQTVYRMMDGRFEQIGQGWLKHGFTALALDLCSDDCMAPGTGRYLGVNCSDPYSAGLNGSQRRLGPKFQVNALTGEYDYPFFAQDMTGDEIYKRIQVENDDLEPDLNPGALYFIEGQYVTPDDAQAGNGYNNASYRKVVVDEFADGDYDLVEDEPTVRTEAAIFAWAAFDPTVTITTAHDEQGGRFHVGSKVTDIGGGFWSYEYAVHNYNSHLSMRSFVVPLAPGTMVRNVGFHDVDYHSGEPYDDTDWPDNISASEVSWTTDSFDVNANANALRWGTTYNFRFEANVAPGDGPGTLGLYRPAAEDEVVVTVPIPGCDSLASAEAGDDSVACPGDVIVLDAASSDVATCPNPTYRWLAEDGTELSPFSNDPTLMVPFRDCPGTFFTVEIACEGSDCISTDIVRVGCIELDANAGTNQFGCSGTPITLDATRSGATNCDTLQYRWLDDDGMALTGWTEDPLYTFDVTSADQAGDYRVEIRCVGAELCMAFDDVSVDVAVVTVDLRNERTEVCVGDSVTVPAGDVVGFPIGCSALEYRWSIDGLFLTDWTADATVDLPALADCSAPITATLEARCADMGLQNCISTTSMEVACPTALLPTPIYTADCGAGTATLDCGLDTPGATFWWDIDLTTDSDGDGDPTNDMDLNGCEAMVAVPGGSLQVMSWVSEPSAGCPFSAMLDVDVVTTPAPEQVTGVRLTIDADELVFSWDGVVGLSYRIVRGDLPTDGSGTFDLHGADGTVGRGTCSTGEMATWSDPDDHRSADSYYYLVAAVNACDDESTLGTNSMGEPRALRESTMDCP